MSTERRRIAIVSSPRSGNSWIRSVLAGALGMSEVAVHNLGDIKNDLPEHCFLQIHWYREPNFQKWLFDHQFKILCVARHPLDILLSVLHFIRYEPDTSRWLEGNVALPASLMNASPTDAAFLDYALSFGAENLLSISYQWWQDSSVIKLRYEDCVANPAGVLGDIVKNFGGESTSVLPWLERLSLRHMQATKNRHGWQGKPGLYKKLIPSFAAIKIRSRYKRIFDVLNYRVEPYFLTSSRAHAHWLSLL